MSSLETASEICRRVAEATEASILDQLNDFVSRGLITIERTGPTLVVESPDSRTMRVAYSVRLVLKDKEYITALEQECRELKAKLEEIINAVGEHL